MTSMPRLLLKMSPLMGTFLVLKTYGAAMPEASDKKSRLGRGLSGMLAAPVAIQSPTQSSQNESSVTTTLSGPPKLLGLSTDINKLRSVPLDAIVPNRFQPRRRVDGAHIETLAASIKSSGLIQPIAVRPLPGRAQGGPQWEIIAGERRWRAAALAGLETIPVIVTDLDDRGAAEWAIVENVQREDLNPIDRAWAFRGLMEHFGMSATEVGERVGMDRSTVTNFVRLTELEREIQSLLAEGKLTAGHGRALLSAPVGPQRIAAATLACQDGWSVRQTEAWCAEAAASAVGEAHGSKQPTHAEVSAERAELERQLSEYLGTRVRVQTSAAGNKGRLVIEFYDLEHFDGVMQRIGFRLRS